MTPREATVRREKKRKRNFRNFRGRSDRAETAIITGVARVIQGGCEIIGGEKLIIFQRHGKKFGP